MIIAFCPLVTLDYYFDARFKIQNYQFRICECVGINATKVNWNRLRFDLLTVNDVQKMCINRWSIESNRIKKENKPYIKLVHNKTRLMYCISIQPLQHTADKIPYHLQCVFQVIFLFLFCFNNNLSSILSTLVSV